MTKHSRKLYVKQLLQKPSKQSKEKYIAFTEERIYGTVTLMAINLGLLFQPGLKATTALSITVSTAFGLWLAGMFAAITAFRIGHDKSMSRSELVHEVTIHRGLLLAALPTVMMVLLAVLGVIETQTAIIASLAIAAVAMIDVIIRSANTARNSLQSTIIVIGVQVLIALVVIAIKLEAK